MLIISKSENEVLKSIKYLFIQEKIDFEFSFKYKNNNYNKIIFITNDINEIPKKIKKDVLIITDRVIDIKNISFKCNEIVTCLVNDNNNYTSAQEEYLFRDGIYNVINELVLDFINNRTIDKLIYDTSCCKLKPTDWVFGFDSIAETYAWLSRKNRCIEKERKVIETCKDVIFNDSDKEINYLSEYISLAKKGMKITTIYACTPETIEEKKNNKFFNLLTKRIGDNVKSYFCNVKVLEEKEPELLDIIGDGIAIYDDCVYQDDFSSEFSLGFVDCKLESVKKYNEKFDYLLNNYCVLITNEDNNDGI